MIRSLYQRNKKGVLTGTVIFLILNVVFFTLVLFFASQSISGLDIKEKILAKQIALFVNSAKPETLMIFNIQKYIDMAEKKLEVENIVKIEDGNIKVKLNEDTFVYPHFSDYNIEYEISGGFLQITVK